MAVESRLAEWRKRRGVAAAELARTAGVSRQTIYAMEAGDYIPNTVVALQLARILECTVEELFQLESPEAQAPSSGFSLSVPESWWEFDIRPEGRDATVRALVDERIREVPELHEYRADLSAMLRRMAKEAYDSGAV